MSHHNHSNSHSQKKKREHLHMCIDVMHSIRQAKHNQHVDINCRNTSQLAHRGAKHSSAGLQATKDTTFMNNASAQYVWNANLEHSSSTYIVPTYILYVIQFGLIIMYVYMVKVNSYTYRTFDDILHTFMLFIRL